MSAALEPSLAKRLAAQCKPMKLGTKPVVVTLAQGAAQRRDPQKALLALAALAVIITLFQMSMTAAMRDKGWHIFQ